jgi:hypothetical protein
VTETESSRSTSSRLLRPSQRNSAGWLLMVQAMWSFFVTMFYPSLFIV